MTYSTATSSALFARALRVLVEGGSSPSRGPANYRPYPLFIARGEGAEIVDVDGNRYIDWMMAYGALPLGHAHPEVAVAVAQAATTGTLFAAATEIEVEVAELIQRMVPGAERVRFANTGTEAVMAAVRLARGVTGRPKIVKFEGHYHGWYDDVLVSAHPRDVASLGHPRDPVRIAESSGLNRHALDDTVVVPWNDLEALEHALDTHRGQVAAVLTEGVMANMGVIPPEPGYLQGLERAARDHGALVILDETVTGFRVAPGGCQELYGLSPDLSTFGKALGAGLPVAAICGRAEWMDGFRWGGVLHYGTQNASRVGLAAARAALTRLGADGGAVFGQMRRLADRLVQGLRRVFASTGTPAIVQHVGPMWQIFFTDRPAIRNYREFCAAVDRARFQRFARALFRHGVYLSPSAALHSVVTLAHDERHVDRTLAAVEAVLAEGDAARESQDTGR